MIVAGNACWSVNLSDPLLNLGFMEILRVLIDSSDACPSCGSPTTVFQRTDDEIEWIDEYRECGYGCDEVGAAILASAPTQRSQRSRRARVA